MHASYSAKSDYLVHRVAQAWEFAKLLRAASQRRRGRGLVIGLGDLNTEPGSLPWRIVKHRVPEMHDTWLASPYRKGPPPGTEADDGDGSPDGATYGSPYNTWQWTRDQRKCLAGQEDTPTGELTLPPGLEFSQAVRIDYILASVAEPLATSESRGAHKGSGPDDDGAWVVEGAKVGMLDRLPKLCCSLSDHFSVEVTLAFRKRQPRAETSDLLDMFTESIQATPGDGYAQGVSSGYVPTATSPGPMKETKRLIDEILFVLGEYKSQRQRHGMWRKFKLGVAGLVMTGSLAGVWAVDAGWCRFLLAAAGALALAFAALDGWGVMLFDLAEGAALGELEWELRNFGDWRT